MCVGVFYCALPQTSFGRFMIPEICTDERLVSRLVFVVLCLLAGAFLSGTLSRVVGFCCAGRRHSLFATLEGIRVSITLETFAFSSPWKLFRPLFVC